MLGCERGHVTEDLPPDVHTVLTQLFTEGREALEAGERDAAIEAVASAETVVTNKLPEGPFRDRLLHGCVRVRRLLDAGIDDPSPPEGADTSGGDRTDAAAAYLAAMERRVADADDGA